MLTQGRSHSKSHNGQRPWQTPFCMKQSSNWRWDMNPGLSLSWERCREGWICLWVPFGLVHLCTKMLGQLGFLTAQKAPLTVHTEDIVTNVWSVLEGKSRLVIELLQPLSFLGWAEHIEAGRGEVKWIKLGFQPFCSQLMNVCNKKFQKSFEKCKNARKFFPSPKPSK